MRTDLAFIRNSAVFRHLCNRSALGALVLGLTGPSAAATDYTFTRAVDYDWWTPANWSPIGVPGPNDTATIDFAPDAAYAWVYLSGDISVRTLNFNRGAILRSGTLHGTLNWRGGNFVGDGGLTLAPDATLNILPGGDKGLTTRYHLVNRGTIHWNEPLVTMDGGQVLNQAGGLIVLDTDRMVTGYVNSEFKNEADARFLVTTDAVLPANLPLTTAGTVEVASGTLTLDGHLDSTGAWLLPDGAGLTIRNGGKFTAGTKFDGPGPVTLAGGVVRFDGETIAPNLMLSGSMVTGGLSLKGNLDWTAGQISLDAVLEVQAGSTVNVLPGGVKGFDYRTRIYNAGVFHWNAPLTTADGFIYNQAGGLMLLRTATPVSGWASAPFENQPGARLQVRDFTETLNWPAGLSLDQRGAIEILQGTLRLPGDYAPKPESTLRFGIGGATAGAGHGQLAVAGLARLAGEIHAELAGGFRPNRGDEFVVVTFGSHDGAFANSTVDTGQGAALSVDHRPSGVALVVESMVEQPCVTVTNNLVGWWRGSGNALDSVGANHGTPRDGADFLPGLVGQAFSLDGIDDFVQIPASTSLSVTGAITVAAWIHPSTMESSRTSTIASKYNALARRVSWHLSVARGGLRFLVGVNGDVAGTRWADTAQNLLPTGTWSHVSGSYDPPTRTLRLFINGKEVSATLGSSQAVTRIFDSVEPVRIGSLVSGTGVITNHFAGRIDELSLHHRALTGHELQALYLAGRDGGCIRPPIIAAPETLTSGSVGLAYEQSFQANLGVAPYSFALGGGSLPTGLSLTSEGRLAGVPITPGKMTFDLRVTDALGQTARRTYEISILEAAPVFSRVPQSQQVKLGDKLWLEAETRSPAEFQWFLNGAEISGAKGPELLIPFFTAAQAGRYRVRARNAQGESFSPEVAVQIEVPPAVIEGPKLEGGSVQVWPDGSVNLLLSTKPGYTYELERVGGLDEINDAAWRTVVRFVATESRSIVKVPNGRATDKGFFRFRELPPPPPIAYSLADDTRFIGIAEDGQPRPGYLPNYEPATGRLGPLEFHPSGAAASSDRRLTVRLPGGGRVVVEGERQYIETAEAEVAFAPESPIQLARPLRLQGETTTRIPLRHLDVPTLQQLYAAAGTPMNDGIEIVVFRHFHLLLTAGQFDADQIRQAQLAWGDGSGRRLPLPQRAGGYADFHLSLELRDHVLRLPFWGEFALSDGTASPLTLRVPKSHPLVLELYADNHVSLKGRAEVAAAGGLSFMAEVSLDDPLYRLRLAARHLRVPPAVTVPDLLPLPDVGESVEATAIEATTALFVTALDAHTAFGGLLGAEEAFAGTGVCADFAPVGAAPSGPSAVLQFWRGAVEAGALSTLSEEVLAAIRAASGTAAASEDLSETLRVLAELKRLTARLPRETLTQSPAVVEALDEATAAAERVLRDAPESATLGQAAEIARVAFQFERFVQEQGRVGSTVIPALTDYLDRVTRHFLTTDLAVQSGVSTAPAGSRIAEMPPWEAMLHIQRLLDLECVDQRLGGRRGLTRSPVGEALAQLGRRMTEHTRATLQDAALRGDGPRYRLALSALGRLAHLGSDLGAADGSLPTAAEFDDAFAQLAHPELAGALEEPDEVLASGVGRSRDEARLLRDLLTLPSTPTALLGRLHGQIGQRLRALFTQGGGENLPSPEALLARIEAHLAHEELRLRFALATDSEALLFELENALEALARQSLSCTNARALTEAARLILATTRRLGGAPLPEEAGCVSRSSFAPSAPAGSVAQSRLKLLRFAHRCLAGSKEIGTQLWARSVVRRNADPSLVLADMLLPGGFAIEEAAAELEYNARAERLRGALKGRLRVPQFNGAFTLANASFDSGGAFRMSAYGSAAFPRDHPSMQIEVPARRPLQFALDLDRHVSLDGAAKVRLRNGLAFEGWLTLNDPLYQVGARATGLRFELANNLSGQIQVLDPDHLRQIPAEMQGVLKDYLSSLGATLDPLTELANAPQFGTVGEPPEFRESIVDVDLAPVVVSAKAIRLAVNKPAAMGFAGATQLHQWFTNHLAKLDAELSARINAASQPPTPGGDPDVSRRLRACEVAERAHLADQLDQALADYNAGRRNQPPVSAEALDHLREGASDDLGTLLDDGDAFSDPEAMRCLHSAAESLLNIERRRRGDVNWQGVDARRAATILEKEFELGNTMMVQMEEALNSGAPSPDKFSRDRLQTAAELITEAASSGQAMGLGGENLNWSDEMANRAYFLHRNVVHREIAALGSSQAPVENAIVASHRAYTVGMELVVEMEHFRQRLGAGNGGSRRIKLYHPEGGFTEVEEDPALGMDPIIQREIMNGAGKAYVQFAERTQRGVQGGSPDAAAMEALRIHLREIQRLRERHQTESLLEALRRDDFFQKYGPVAAERLREQSNPAARLEYQLLKDYLASINFKLRGAELLGGLRRALRIARDVEGAGFSAAAEVNRNQDLLDDFQRTVLPGFQAEITALARARQAWWIATQATDVLYEGLANKAERDLGAIDLAARQAASGLMELSAGLVRALKDHLRTDFANFDLRLPGDLIVREAWGQLTVNTSTRDVQGCLGGALEFPEINNFRVAVPRFCLATDGSFSLAAELNHLPAGTLDGQPVTFNGSFSASGQSDAPVTVTRGDIAPNRDWQGKIDLRGRGSLTRGIGASAKTVAAELRYNLVRLGDQSRWHLSFDASFEGVQRFGQDVVLFKANTGFGGGAQRGDDSGQTATLRVGGKLGLWRKDRGVELPADDARIKPEMFQLVVDDVQLAATEHFSPVGTTDNGYFELTISAGTLRLPDMFYATDLPEGLRCELGDQPRTGASIAVLPTAPLVARAPFANGQPQPPELRGAIRFSHFGFALADLDNFGASICQAELVFDNDGPALLIDEGRLNLPLPGENLALALRNVRFDLHGLPVGEIALAEPFKLIDAGGFEVVLLAPGKPARFLPPPTLSPDEREKIVGTRLKVYHPEGMPGGTRYLRFEGGLEIVIPAALLGAENANSSTRAPEALTSGDDQATVGAAVAGFFEIRPRGLDLPDVELGLTRFAIGAENATWRLGPSGIKVTNPAAEFENLPALWNIDPRNPAKITLTGQVELQRQFKVSLRNARFVFDQPNHIPRFVMDSAELTEGEDAFIKVLPVRLKKLGMSFVDSSKPLPDLLAPQNVVFVFTAKVGLPAGDAAILEGELADVRVGFGTDGLPVFPNLNGFELGLVGDKLKVPPFDTITGKVRVGGLSMSENPDDLYLVGELMAKQQTMQFKILSAFSGRGPLGMCLDVSLGSSAIPIAYGFVVLGGQGGINFSGGGGDPCQFTTYFERDAAGLWRVKENGLPPSPIQWEDFRRVLRQMEELAHQLEEAAGQVGPLDARPNVALARATPHAAAADAPRNSSEIECATCPPRTVNLLCQPHPDSVRHPHRVILKFTSITEQTLNHTLHVTEDTFRNHPAATALAGDLAQRTVRFVRDSTPLPDASLPAFRPLADYIDAALTAAEKNVSNLVYQALDTAADRGAPALYAAVRDLLYDGIPCQDITLAMAGRVSYVGLSAFAFVEGRIVQSSAGSQGVIGTVNLLGLPVGQGSVFVSMTDDQGLPNPSLCGKVDVAVGPLDIGHVTAVARCDGCVTTIVGIVPQLARLLGEPLVRDCLTRAAPHLGSLAGLTLDQLLAKMSALPADELLALQTRFLANLADFPPNRLPRDLPAEFVRLLGANWEKIQPKLTLCGEVTPKIFGLPLTPASELVRVEFKADKEGYTGGFEFAPSGLNAIFPPGDLATFTFDLRARDQLTVLLGALDGRLSSVDEARRFAEEQINYALEHATMAIGYQWHPFGLQLGDAAVRVLMPDLVDHPARLGAGQWRTPEQGGLPSRHDVLVAATVNGLLKNAFLWKGNVSDLAKVFPEDDPRHAALANRDLRKDYFPHGGIVGGAQMALPKILMESPRQWLPLWSDFTQKKSMFDRLEAAAKLIEEHVLATETNGTASFYLPAPNPPIGDSFDLTPPALVERIRQIDWSAPNIRDVYPGEYSFLRADLDHLNLLGVPIAGTARLRGSLAPTPIQKPGPLATLTATLERESWLGRLTGRALTMEANLHATPPQAVQERFATLLAGLRAELAKGKDKISAFDGERWVGQARTALFENLPKFGVTNKLPDLVVENPASWTLRRSPTPLPPVLKLTGGKLHGFTPYFAPDTAGEGPVAQARRLGGFAAEGSFALLPGTPFEESVEHAEFSLVPNGGLPRVIGSLQGLTLNFYPGLGFGDANVAFDTGNPSGEFLIVEKDFSALSLPRGIFTVGPGGGGPLHARLALRHATGNDNVLQTFPLPVSPELSLAPARVSSTLISGPALRIHGPGGAGSEFTFSPTRFDARVTLETSAAVPANSSAEPQQAAVGALVVRATLPTGGSLAVLGVSGLPRSDLFKIEGSSESFRLRLDARNLPSVTVTFFPELDALPGGFPNSIRIDPALGLNLTIASDGAFELEGRLGQPYAHGGVAFGVNAAVTISNRGISLTAASDASSGSLRFTWNDQGQVQPPNASVDLTFRALRSPLVSLTAEDGGDFHASANTDGTVRLSRPRLTLHGLGLDGDWTRTLDDLQLPKVNRAFDTPPISLSDALKLRGFPLGNLREFKASGDFDAGRIGVSFLADLRLEPLFNATFRVALGTDGLRLALEPPDSRVTLLGFRFDHAHIGATNSQGALPSLSFSGELDLPLPWGGGLRPRFAGRIPASGAFELTPLNDVLPELGFALRKLSQTFRYRPGGYPAIVQEDAPVAYWRMEESIPRATSRPAYSENLADFGPSEVVTGTYSPKVPSSRTGGEPPRPPMGGNDGAFNPAANRSVLFDGVDDFATVPLIADQSRRLNATGPSTIELWFRRSTPNVLSAASQQCLAAHGEQWNLKLVPVTTVDSKGRPHTATHLAFHVDGLRALESMAAVNQLLSTRVFDDTLWHHVVAVFDGMAQFLFIDGQLDNVVATAGQPASVPSLPVTLAGQPTDDGVRLLFEGSLDEVAFFDRALTPSEVLNHHLAAGRGGLHFEGNLGEVTGISGLGDAGVTGLAGGDGSVALSVSTGSEPTLGAIKLPEFSGSVFRTPVGGLLVFRAALPPPPGFSGSSLDLKGYLRADGSFNLRAHGERLEPPQPFAADAADRFRMVDLEVTASRMGLGRLNSRFGCALDFPRFLGADRVALAGTLAPLSLSAPGDVGIDIGPGRFALTTVSLTDEGLKAAGAFEAGGKSFANAALLANKDGIAFRAAGDTGWVEAHGKKCESFYKPPWYDRQGKFHRGEWITECVDLRLGPPYMRFDWKLGLTARPSGASWGIGGRFQVNTGRGNGESLLNLDLSDLPIGSTGELTIDRAANAFSRFLPKLW